MRGSPEVDRLVPLPGDLPGGGWVALDEPISGGAGGEGEFIDCVGPDFPGPDETTDTAASPHFVRAPHQLVHGIAVLFTTSGAAGRAAAVLRGPSFAECLGRSVATDLLASPAAAEVLTIDVTPVPGLQRVTFSTGSLAGVRPIHLDIAVLVRGRALSLLWFADTPHPFSADLRRTVSDRIGLRLEEAEGDDSA